MEERKGGLSIDDDQFDDRMNDLGESGIDESKNLIDMQVSRNIQYIDDVLKNMNEED